LPGSTTPCRKNNRYYGRRFPLVNFNEAEGHVYSDALVPGVDLKEIDFSVLRNPVTINRRNLTSTTNFLTGEAAGEQETGLHPSPAWL
jgi:HSP20 family molecular chaperone IbpA